MPLSQRNVINALENKFGFTRDNKHHTMFRLTLPDIPIIITKVSHSRREIGRKLEAKMARQLRVRTRFFREMIDCTKDRDEYYDQVTTDPYPPFETYRR